MSSGPPKLRTALLAQAEYEEIAWSKSQNLTTEVSTPILSKLQLLIQQEEAGMQDQRSKVTTDFNVQVTKLPAIIKQAIS